MAKIDITKTELVWHNEAGTRKEIPRVNLPFQVIETVNESRATRAVQRTKGSGLKTDFPPEAYAGVSGVPFLGARLRLQRTGRPEDRPVSRQFAPLASATPAALSFSPPVQETDQRPLRGTHAGADRGDRAIADEHDRALAVTLAEKPFDHLKRILQILLSVETALLGSAMGFYYGSQMRGGG